MDGNADLQPEPTFGDLVNLIRRGLLFALAVAVGAALVTFFVTKHLAPTYQATATVLESQPDNALQQFGVSLVTAPQVDVTAYQAAATSNPVLVAAMSSLGVKNPSEKQVEALLKRVSVRIDANRQSSLLHIDVNSGAPEAAANTANAVANALLNWDKQRATQNLDKVVQALQGQIASLTAQIAEAQAAKTPDTGEISGLETLRAQQSLQLNSARALVRSAVGNLEILEPAVVPIQPVAPQPLRDAGLAFVLGLVLVYGIVLLRDVLDTRFHGPDDLARSSNLPILAEFPRMTGASRRLPREAANFLRTNVLFATASEHPKVIVVTSARPSEGKTSVAMSLAESLARNDYRTLLIDADLRDPTIGAEYGLSPVETTSTRTLLEDPTMEFQPAVLLVDHVALHVIPAFSPAPLPSELLSHGMSKLLARLSEAYDVIIIDSAPVLPVADALTIAPHCTGVLFTVSLPTIDRKGVNAALALLDRIGVRVLGLVTTNVVLAKRGQRHYGYGYGYGEAYGDQPAVVAQNSKSQNRTIKNTAESAD